MNKKSPTVAARVGPETNLKRRNNSFSNTLHSLASEVLFSLRVAVEFLQGFRILHYAGPCVAVFGSARIKEGSRYYEDARSMGGRLAESGFSVIIGGGPGIMEAANRGAREHHGLSIGCNIALKKEQETNSYLDKQFSCKHFFVRKVLMFRYSSAFIIMPGGTGTLDEFFEALNLVQTHKIKDFPIVVFGKAYWSPLMSLFSAMLSSGTITQEDLNNIIFTDVIQDAIAHIELVTRKKYTS